MIAKFIVFFSLVFLISLFALNFNKVCKFYNKIKDKLHLNKKSKKKDSKGDGAKKAKVKKEKTKKGGKEEKSDDKLKPVVTQFRPILKPPPDKKLEYNKDSEKKVEDKKDDKSSFDKSQITTNFKYSSTGAPQQKKSLIEGIREYDAKNRIDVKKENEDIRNFLKLPEPKSSNNNFGFQINDDRKTNSYSQNIHNNDSNIMPLNIPALNQVKTKLTKVDDDEDDDFFNAGRVNVSNSSNKINYSNSNNSFNSMTTRNKYSKPAEYEPPIKKTGNPYLDVEFEDDEPNYFAPPKKEIVKVDKDEIDMNNLPLNLKRFIIANILNRKDWD